LFAHLAAVLSGHSHRRPALLGKPGVIHHLRHYRITAQHRWDHKIQTAIQYRFVTPGGVGDDSVAR
jgi:hypothetical protein